jgi:hypothetical protein
MSEQARFASELAESLSLAVRSTEHSEYLPTLTGMSEFTAHTIQLRNSIETNETLASFEIAVEDYSEVPAEVSIVEGESELSDSIEIVSETEELDTLETDSAAETTNSEVEEFASDFFGTTIQQDLGTEASGVEEDSALESKPDSENSEFESENVKEVVENSSEAAEEIEKYSLTEEVVLITEWETSEELIEEKTELATEALESVEASAAIEEAEVALSGETEEELSEEVEQEVVAVISDEEWAIQEFGEDTSIDLVADLTLDDVWENIAEPEADDATVPLEARKEKDQVVLVVEQLVVSPSGNTTILGADGEPAGGPVRPAQYAQPQQQPIIYQPAPAPVSEQPPPVIMQQAPVMPVMPSMPTAPHQQPIIYNPPQIYNPPAEINVSISAPAPTQPQYVENIQAPAQSPNNNSGVPVYEAPAEAAVNMPQEVAEKLRDPDQVIEIRSDATSISANTVSVSSFSTPLPSLVNFDPRKYFNPNEIIPPKLEATIKVEHSIAASGSNDYAAESIPKANSEEASGGNIQYSAPESLNAVVLPVEEPLAINLKEEVTGDAASRVTQMFGELRRFRDK